jgi:hypothetical protein
MIGVNQFLSERNKRLLFGFIGFGVPAIFILLQVLFDFGTLPLMVVMLSWFGIALLIYLGVSEE